jgi:excisionase family DNA binding protein
MNRFRRGLTETRNMNLGAPVLVRLKVAAGRLGVSVRTVYRIIAEGGLRLVHVRGCACVYENDLVSYMERNTERKSA